MSIPGQAALPPPEPLFAPPGGQSGRPALEHRPGGAEEALGETPDPGTTAGRA